MKIIILSEIRIQKIYIISICEAVERMIIFGNTLEDTIIQNISCENVFFIWIFDFFLLSFFVCFFFLFFVLHKTKFILDIFVQR